MDELKEILENYKNGLIADKEAYKLLKSFFNGNNVKCLTKECNSTLLYKDGLCFTCYNNFK